VNRDYRSRSRITDVARVAGVSKTSVSFAFNNPERLSADTARRILEVADELGYRPDPVARMLSQGRTRTLGILTPQALSVVLANPFFGGFLAGVAAVAEEAAYRLLLVSPVHGSLARAVAQATVDGFVVLGLAEDHSEVEQVRQANLPIVMVDSSAFPDRVSVAIDDELGARLAAEHLIELGHCDVLVIGMHQTLPASDPAVGGVIERRLAGYRAGLERGGVELDDSHVVTGPATVDGGASCFSRAWASGVRPTGVLAMSDVMAIGAIGAIGDHGLSVPSDISVVGFDDIDLAAHVRPALTTVHQPGRHKGEQAGRLLLALLERGYDDIPQHLVLETRLVVRASTAGAPSPPGGPRGSDPAGRFERLGSHGT